MEKSELLRFFDLLRALASGNRLCEWDEYAEKCYQEIRKLIESQPIIQTPLIHKYAQIFSEHVLNRALCGTDQGDINLYKDMVRLIKAMLAEAGVRIKEEKHV